MSRVLVVDDSPTIRRVVGSVLQRAGHETATADDGARAVAEVAAVAPDLVLLDLTIPTLDGMAVLERLAGGEAPVPPVILMATRSDGLSGVDERLRRLGVVDVITKPFSPEALLAVVHHNLEKRAAAARAARLRDFGDDERTLPAGSIAATTVVGPPIASTRHASVPGSSERSATSSETPKLALPAGFGIVGDLAVIALPEVLQLLKFQSHSGRLVVQTGELQFEVGLEDGAIVMIAASSGDGGPARQGEYRLGRYLVATGAIDDVTLEARLQDAPPDGLLGERLVKVGALGEDDLRRAVAEQAQDFMVELLRARGGVFGLQTGREYLPERVVRPGWSIDMLLFEALRRVDEWGVIEGEVPSFEARFALRGALDDSGLSPEEATILRALEAGPARVRAIVSRSPLRPFDVCRVLYRLAVLKRIQRIDDGDPRRLLNDERPPSEPVLSMPPRMAGDD